MRTVMRTIWNRKHTHVACGILSDPFVRINDPLGQLLQTTDVHSVNTSCHVVEFDYICENIYEGPFVVEKFVSEDVEGVEFERLCYNGTEGGRIKTRYFGKWRK